jgi:hypothetical protein
MSWAYFCLAMSGHIVLCVDQSDAWHVRPQYVRPRHLEQRDFAPVCPHTQQVGLEVACPRVPILLQRRKRIEPRCNEERPSTLGPHSTKPTNDTRILGASDFLNFMVYQVCLPEKRIPASHSPQSS